MYLKLGEKIRLIRVIRGFNRKEMAYELKITVEAYRKIEDGKTILTNYRIEQICTFLNIEPSKIYELEKLLNESIFTLENLSRSPFGN